MKTIKKLAKEYYKPDNDTVDWSKLVGKTCVVEVYNRPNNTRLIKELYIIDFEETNNIIKFKYDSDKDSQWLGLDSYTDVNFRLIFVFEPIKPEEPKNYKDLSLILEEAKKNNEYIPPKNPLRPVYPYNPGWDYPVNPPSWLKPNNPLQPYCLENDMFRVHDPIYSHQKEYDDHEPWTCHDLQN